MSNYDIFFSPEYFNALVNGNITLSDEILNSLSSLVHQFMHL